jgi:hypothetical protein
LVNPNSSSFYVRISTIKRLTSKEYFDCKKGDGIRADRELMIKFMAMRKMQTKWGIFALFIFFLGGSLLQVNPGWSGTDVDNSLYGELLKDHVKDGVVDYQGFKKEEAKLDRYLKILEKVESNQLSRNEQFAFKSIKDLGSLFKTPWKKKISTIDGEVLTLDNIEHDILRPRFKDPRVHFAINCAAKGCPPLRSDPYEGKILDQQLDEMTRAFINRPEMNRLEGRNLYVSSIFKWFSKDFNKDVIGFFLKYAEGDLKKGLEANKEKIKIRYLDYDWSLNGK